MKSKRKARGPINNSSTLPLVCPRCKKEKEDEDCLYDVYFEVKGIERSSHPGWVLEDFEYRVCGTCQNEIERWIRLHSNKTGEFKK